MSQVTRSSRTQQQRTDEMRRALLDATVQSLTELGFAKTTTLEVQRRAGVSRGALLHHFPAKAELLVAAIRHLADLRGRELKKLAARLPEGGARIDAVLELLWESFSGPLFHVAMELRTAARTDADLRGALIVAERDLHDRILTQSRCLFGTAVASRPGFEHALDMTLQLMTGAAMSAVLHQEQLFVRGLITRWKFVFSTLIEAPKSGTEGK